MNNKIKTREELVSLLNITGLVGFTSGAFDLLHAGHVAYLEEAKTHCEILVVGVNSDQSIKQYKGDIRPIIPEEERLQLVAGLSAVDYVFLFDERRNKVNIQTLKPDLYIKAGDYKPEELTSAKYLEHGEVIIIPEVEGLSTSAIIDKIQRMPTADKIDVKSGPAVFLDRDGVINVDKRFLNDPEQFELLPNVIEGLKAFQNMGYKLIIVTNQGGIGMGYYTEQDFFRVNSKMLQIFSENDILIDKIYYCPHSQAEQCNCRKPNAGMLVRGRNELNVNMDKSVMIGDKASDFLAGKKVGLRTIFIDNNGEGLERAIAMRGRPNLITSDLVSAAKWMEKQTELLPKIEVDCPMPKVKPPKKG